MNFKNKRALWAVLSVFLTAAILFALYQLDQSKQAQTPYSTSDFLMDTTVTQQLYGKNAKAAADEVVARMQAFEKMCSYYLADSQISQINKNAGVAPVSVDQELFDLISRSVEYAKLTDGLFDISIAPLVSLWGVTTDHPKVPTQQEILQARSLIDYQNIVLNPNTREVMLAKAGMSIDLGGIAKGYSCVIAKQVYQEKNIQSGLINIGGNIYTYGKKPGGEGYSIGVSAPIDDRQSLLGRLTIDGYVIASSGGYERYFEQDGAVYHHIFDVRTGYPSDSDLAGVTVLCKDGAAADFLSTYFFVAGSEAVKASLSNTDIGIIACDKQGNVYVSDWVQKDFTLTNSNYTLWEAS